MTCSVAELPETVALFHSLVGAAAVATSVASYMLEPHHAVAAWVGTAIGSVTVTGSLVAYAKLAEKMDSKALNLPGKNMINMVMLGGNMLCLSALALDPLNMSQGVMALIGTTAISSESLLLAWANLASWYRERDSGQPS